MSITTNVLMVLLKLNNRQRVPELEEEIFNDPALLNIYTSVLYEKIMEDSLFSPHVLDTCQFKCYMIAKHLIRGKWVVAEKYLIGSNYYSLYQHHLISPPSSTLDSDAFFNSLNREQK